MQATACWQFILKVLIAAEKVSKSQRVTDPYHTGTCPLQLHLSVYLSVFEKEWESQSFKATAQKLNLCFWAGARRISCILGWVFSQALSSVHDQTGGTWGVNGCFPWLCPMWCMWEQTFDIHMGTDAFFSSSPKQAHENRLTLTFWLYTANLPALLAAAIEFPQAISKYKIGVILRENGFIRSVVVQFWKGYESEEVMIMH